MTSIIPISHHSSYIPEMLPDFDRLHTDYQVNVVIVLSYECMQRQ
jgi:hypothetical protein